MIGKILAAAVVLAISIAGFGVFWSTHPALGGSPIATTSGTFSSTTSTQCTSSTQGVSPTVLNGAFTYSPGGPVKVTSVQALLYPEAGGNASLVFKVAYDNSGTVPIYVAAGCGSSLSSSITSGGGVVETLRFLARCLCAEESVPVQPGASATAVDPGCRSGYSFRVVGSGSFTANLTLSWTGSQNGATPNPTQINAAFNIPPSPMVG